MVKHQIVSKHCENDWGNTYINLKKALTFIGLKKTNFIFYVLLEMLQRYCKLAVLGTLGMSGYTHSKWYYHLVETFVFICRQKINFISHAFSGDIAKICEHFLATLGMPSYMHIHKLIVSSWRWLLCLSACHK